MATTVIRTTYALDVDSSHALDELARRWAVSKSEALRRAIRAASAAAPKESNEAIQALDELQRALKLTPGKARTWAARARSERRAASMRAGFARTKR